MKAAVLVEPGRFELRETARPDPGPGEVMIKVDRAGICGTDIHIFNGRYAAENLPMIPGHEVTGRVDGWGAGVTGFSEGRRVVLDPNIGCGLCYWCLRNEILNCPDMRQIGITMDGGFAEYVAAPARLVIPAPDETPAETLVLAEPLACVVRAARKARATFGQSVAIIGAGPIGNLHAQLMRTIGAAPIIVSDIGADRRDKALACGADIAASPEELPEAVFRATDGRGADIVIESVGRPELYAQALGLMRKGGHLAVFGLADAGESLNIDILRTILEENSLKGSVAGMGPDMRDALTLLVHGRVDASPFTGADYPLSDIQDAFDSLPGRPGDLKTQIVM